METRFNSFQDWDIPRDQTGKGQVRDIMAKGKGLMYRGLDDMDVAEGGLDGSKGKGIVSKGKAMLMMGKAMKGKGKEGPMRIPLVPHRRDPYVWA